MNGRQKHLWMLLLLVTTVAIGGSRPGTTIDFAQASGGGGAREIPFAVAIDPTSFAVEDITQTGTATGISWELVGSDDDRTFILRATAVTGSGTLEPVIEAGVVNDLTGNENLVSIGIHNDVAFAPPPACPSKTYLYMGLWSTPKLFGYCVDNATGILTEQFQMNVDEDVRDLAISDGNLYFAHRDITKYAIDPVDGCITEVAKTPIAGGDIDDILIDAPGVRLYASHHNGRLYVANQWSFLGDPAPRESEEVGRESLTGVRGRTGGVLRLRRHTPGHQRCRRSPLRHQQHR